MNGIERVRDALTGAFPEATVEVRDLTGTGDHVEARSSPRRWWHRV